jgi:hypothetical protein
VQSRRGRARGFGLRAHAPRAHRDQNGVMITCRKPLLQRRCPYRAFFDHYFAG